MRSSTNSNRKRPRMTAIPPDVYDTVLQWVTDEYGIQGRPVVRPFWPGGDYQHEEYPDGCVVIDNPPFSILSKICRWYLEHDIDFFLFAPYLTNFGADIPVNHIVTDTTIVYENGAKVKTAFLTTLGDDFIRTAPGLSQAINAVQDAHKPAPLPSYQYPGEVLTVSRVGQLDHYGIDLRVSRSEVARISRLDSQKTAGKTIFGYGFLMGRTLQARYAEAAEAAEAAKAAKAAKAANDFVWTLSPREHAIIDTLNKTHD
nr:MAG TPA: adenine-specific methyltransferase [Caudoviricetes sp.]